MKKILLFIFFTVSCFYLSAQKIDSIYFNLYTDSLKKGFYNYINVDGKCSDGTWLPLDSTHLLFFANTGSFKGNDIFLDSSYTGDSILVKVSLRKNPSVCKEVVIYIRKRGFDEHLKTSEELWNDRTPSSRKKKKGNLVQL